MRAVLLLGLAVGSFAFGYDAPPPTSFAAPTADGQHVLVVLLKHSGDWKNRIEERYARSGLYPVADPKTPLWTFDWTASDKQFVAIANDTIHAARVPDSDSGLRRWLIGIDKPNRRIPPKPAGLAAMPAAFLYKSGQPFRTVALGEAFDCAALTDVDCFCGPVVQIDAFDNNSGRLRLVIHGERGRQSAGLDIRTGTVVERPDDEKVADCGNNGEPKPISAPQRIGFALLAILTVAVVAFVALALAAIWFKRRPTERPEPDA